MPVLRHKLFIDSDVQGTLLRRAFLYAAACAIYFMVILFFLQKPVDSDESLLEAFYRFFDELIYWLPGFAILTPVIAYDIARVTNRFSGPIYRLRREMIRLAEGRPIGPLSFRGEDHWCEMADVFNRLRNELIELRTLKAEFERAKKEQEQQQQLPRLVDEDEESALEESALSTDL